MAQIFTGLLNLLLFMHHPAPFHQLFTFIQRWGILLTSDHYLSKSLLRLALISKKLIVIVKTPTHSQLNLTHHPLATHHQELNINNISAVDIRIWTKLKNNLFGTNFNRFQVLRGNLSMQYLPWGHICPYQQYLCCFSTNFYQTLKVGF